MRMIGRLLSWVLSGYEAFLARRFDPGVPPEAIVARLDLARGISRPEAKAIATVYALRYISGCGAAKRPSNRGARWEVTPLIGFAARPGPSPIVIEKRSGQVSCAGFPTVNALRELAHTEP
jgi:hypothetical protein